MSSDRLTLADYGVERTRPKRAPDRDIGSTPGQSDSEDGDLEEFGVERDRIHVDDDELESDVTSEELHAAADDAETILDVCQALRIRRQDARHDLAVIERKEELAKGKSFAEKLRGEQ